jgi:8-oxo-dGTP pyrophosphatase MutT (NUDIX family)
MRDVIPEHNIQKRIFNRLVGSESMRYSELKPKEIEANLFMYHLKELMKVGLVEKLEKRYTLTAAGRSTATRFSIREQGIRIMPSAISVLVLESTDGDQLLYRRRRQPYIGALGFPSGKIHLGDTLKVAAYRELDEKCGYHQEDFELTYRGVFNLVEYEETGLKNHIIGHVWHGTVGDKKVFENHAGVTFWADWKVYPYEDFIPGQKEIIEALDAKKFFGIEIYVDNRPS